jgi:hypothetical protein
MLRRVDVDVGVTGGDRLEHVGHVLPSTGIAGVGRREAALDLTFDVLVPVNSVTPTGPLSSGPPQWMCAANAGVVRSSHLISNATLAPSDSNFASPTPSVTTGVGRSAAPERSASA